MLPDQESQTIKMPTMRVSAEFEVFPTLPSSPLQCLQCNGLDGGVAECAHCPGTLLEDIDKCD